ncbi:MAG: hypothetical protein K2H39_05960, partial [Paramuribaculum sp.]|nr:hypothetical protein [Paramuribaculum sp.]
MRIKLIIPAALAAVVMATGCTSNKKFAELQGKYDALAKDYHNSQVELAKSQERANSLDALLAEARKNNDQLKRQYDSMQGSLNQSLQQNRQGSINISKLVDEINASNQYIKQ